MPGDRPFELMLIEDNSADVLLTREVLDDSRIWHRLTVCADGREAMEKLAQPASVVPRPDLILLDLNMPRMDGREFLTLLRQDPELQILPVVVMTTSRAEEDVLRSYKLHANAYITKPMEFGRFVDVIRSIESLWLNIVELPTQS
jgi:CheY-like chemotaxis protein